MASPPGGWFQYLHSLSAAVVKVVEFLIEGRGGRVLRLTCDL